MATINGKSVIHSGAYMIRNGETLECDGVVKAVVRIRQELPLPDLVTRIEDNVLVTEVCGFPAAESRVSQFEANVAGVDVIGAVMAVRIADMGGIISYHVVVTLYHA